MTGFTIGYGGGEIEPKIAPLVAGVQQAGFATFSSCEGHADDQPKLSYTSIGFYAREDDARIVHDFFMRYRHRLACSWVLRGGFVLHQETNEFVLGWTLENWGIIERGDAADFVRRTVEAGWNTDIPLLIDMFVEIRAARTAP
jgi:hypothetical protein